eukprot:8857257-Pyramimonas_sp.AAC.1
MTRTHRSSRLAPHASAQIGDSGVERLDIPPKRKPLHQKNDAPSIEDDGRETGRRKSAGPLVGPPGCRR